VATGISIAASTHEEREQDDDRDRHAEQVLSKYRRASAQSRVRPPYCREACGEGANEVDAVMASLAAGCTGGTGSAGAR
jgi:hypothetical protein